VTCDTIAVPQGHNFDSSLEYVITAHGLQKVSQSLLKCPKVSQKIRLQSSLIEHQPPPGSGWQTGKVGVLEIIDSVLSASLMNVSALSTKKLIECYCSAVYNKTYCSISEYETHITRRGSKHRVNTFTEQLVVGLVRHEQAPSAKRASERPHTSCTTTAQEHEMFQSSSKFQNHDLLYVNVWSTLVHSPNNLHTSNHSHHTPNAIACIPSNSHTPN
jgi:hypothetical protein